MCVCVFPVPKEIFVLPSVFIFVESFSAAETDKGTAQISASELSNGKLKDKSECWQ